MNDEDNAFTDFNMAIKLDGKNAEAWSNQALIYERRGDKVRAAPITPSEAIAGPYLPSGPRTAWRVRNPNPFVPSAARAAASAVLPIGLPESWLLRSWRASRSRRGAQR